MTKGRVETIDVFRGIAILMVVLFHFTARLPASALNITDGAPAPVFFGWVGVYFFFIISGYCIFMTLERSATVGLFLARRFSRIYPAFFAAVLLLFAFGLIAYVPSVPEANFHETAPGLLDVLLNLLFVGEIGEWVDGAFWSIAVEVKFYVLVALLAGALGDHDRFARVFGSLALVMGVLWAASTTLSAAGDGPITPQSMLKFLAIAPYLSFFAVGILGRRLQQGLPGTTKLLWANVTLSTAILWVEAYGFELHDGALTATICAAAYLALALVFIRFAAGKSIPTVPLLSAAIAKVGLLSFSWYLIHENVGISFLATFDLYLPAWLSLAVTLATTFLMAVVFASLVEWRFRKPVEKAAMALLDWVGRHVRGLAALRTGPVVTAAE
jgi:peptidoglycan/LPS O-acetylase OafA/YrhL